MVVYVSERRVPESTPRRVSAAHPNLFRLVHAPSELDGYQTALSFFRVTRVRCACQCGGPVQSP